jgi:uncharacterized repeat protein (TIGR03847 family)
VLIELDPVHRITADAIGAPGERVFYIQARQADRLVTLLVEKQQLQLLAASVVEILSRVGKETAQGPPEEAMELEEPILPEWRVGRLSIGYQEERDLIVLEAEEVTPEAEDDDEAAGGEPEPRGGLASFEVEEPDPQEMEEAFEGLEGFGREEPGEGGPRRVRFWATREQMLSFARHGAAVCARGRPRCQLCGNPIEPEGHHCPALDGQGDFGEASS